MGNRSKRTLQMLDYLKNTVPSESQMTKIKPGEQSDATNALDEDFMSATDIKPQPTSGAPGPFEPTQPVEMAQTNKPSDDERRKRLIASLSGNAPEEQPI